MKSYEEMAESVFSRRNEYNKARRQRQNTIKLLSATAACFCLVAFIGFGVWQSGIIKSNQGIGVVDSNQSVIVNDSTAQNSNDVQSDQNGTSSMDSTSHILQAKISINEISKPSDVQIETIALKADDFQNMTVEELQAYYGATICPDNLPDDLDMKSDGGYGALGIYESNDRGVYWDQNAIYYTNPEKNRVISINVAKGRYPFYDINTRLDKQMDLTKSVINDIELVLCHYKSTNADGEGMFDSYYAQFMIDGVGFDVTSFNLTRDEFIEALQSLLK